MIKFENDEFLKPQIYSTNDEYEARCNVTKEIVDDVKQLQQENKQLKEVIDKAINDLNIIIDIVREQPLGSDCWIIDRLEANKSILKEVE